MIFLEFSVAQRPIDKYLKDGLSKNIVQVIKDANF